MYLLFLVGNVLPEAAVVKPIYGILGIIRLLAGKFVLFSKKF